jgi:thioredoxin reductase
MIKTQVVVIGSGPGGYTAAFRAADLGKKVTLIVESMTRGSSNGKAGILVTLEPAAMIACSNSITSSVASPNERIGE